MTRPEPSEFKEFKRGFYFCKTVALSILGGKQMSKTEPMTYETAVMIIESLQIREDAICPRTREEG